MNARTREKGADEILVYMQRAMPADYRDGSQLDITMRGVLGRIARDEAGYRSSSGA